jgi:hypothetical protein
VRYQDGLRLSPPAALIFFVIAIERELLLPAKYSEISRYRSK